MEHKDYSERGFWSRALMKWFGIGTETPCQTFLKWVGVVVGFVVGLHVACAVFFSGLLPLVDAISELGLSGSAHRFLSALGLAAAVFYVGFALLTILIFGDFLFSVASTNDAHVDKVKGVHPRRPICSPYLDSKTYEKKKDNRIERDFDDEFSSLSEEASDMSSLYGYLSLIGLIPVLIGAAFMVLGIDFVSFNGSILFGPTRFTISMGLLAACFFVIFWFTNQLTYVLNRKITEGYVRKRDRPTED